MPEPLRLRFLLSRLGVDEAGITLGVGISRRTISWDRLAYIGVDHNPFTMLPAMFARGGAATLSALAWPWRPVLNFCVVGNPELQPCGAVKFARRSRLESGHRDDDLAHLRSVFGPWFDRLPALAPETPELSVWWFAQPESRPEPMKPPPPSPATHERAAKVQHELDDLQDQLRRIEAREKRDRPPA